MDFSKYFLDTFSTVGDLFGKSQLYDQFGNQVVITSTGRIFGVRQLPKELIEAELRSNGIDPRSGK